MTAPGIQVRGLGALMRKLDEERLLVGPVREMVERLALFVQGKAREGAKPHPGDRGELARSIRTDMASARASIDAITAKVAPHKEYAWPVEKGRRPGKMPPSDAIGDFLRRHGGDPKLGFVVARAIGRKGTKGIHYMRNALRAGNARVKEEVGPTMRQIRAIWNGP